MTERVDPLVSVVEDCFRSPNVSDSNGESANLVDTTNNIAKALWKIAEALATIAENQGLQR